MSSTLGALCRRAFAAVPMCVLLVTGVAGSLVVCTSTASAATKNPGSGMSTNFDWATLVLEDGGWPTSGNNVTTMTQWMTSEEPTSDWWDRNNPLNNGLGSGGGSGLGSYSNLPTAAYYVAANLENPDYGYPAIAADFASSAAPSVTATAIEDSDWASSHYGYGSGWYTGSVRVVAAPVSAWGSSPPPPAAGSAVALQANTNALWTWAGTPGKTGFGATTVLGMMPGTSPSITVLANGKYAVAFQANTGVLYTWTGTPGTTGLGASTGLGMKAGTSPTIAADGDDAAVAFEANTGQMWTWSGAPDTTGYGATTRLGMDNATSPSIARLANGKSAVAFQANTGALYTWTGTPGTTGLGASTELGMKVGTSPSVTAAGTGAGVAFEANTGQMWTWSGAPDTTGYGATTLLGMDNTTSPSI